MAIVDHHAERAGGSDLSQCGAYRLVHELLVPAQFRRGWAELGQKHGERPAVARFQGSAAYALPQYGRDRRVLETGSLGGGDLDAM